ncbi:hypothetical protein SAMN04487983_101733 [Streptomyces sp. yr375]|uniref:DUF5944 family protein n=1 Tax=Streptomyces sp. yr375 TaxID=1761906 RepID=UPI0008D66F24|nr:DUF5944 family protein [Streptomyces sp. yr375]SER48256.1 hypothetical protein SAMN04487983_101733 [Streptomyces sp. yr375]
MPASFTATPAMSVVRNEDFAHTSDIAAVFAGHLTSRQLPLQDSPVECAIAVEAVDGGVKLTFTSAVDAGRIGSGAVVTHKFFFVDREECRIRMHALSAEQPAATSELLVLFAEGQERDYCHASVYDAENRLIAAHAVVFDRRGRYVPYAFTEQYVSPLRLGRAALEVVRDDAGRRVARWCVGLDGLDAPERVNVAWEAAGLVHAEELLCTPEEPQLRHDMPLDDNARLAPGDWVVIATDEKGRLLAQTLVTLTPAEASAWRS